MRILHVVPTYLPAVRYGGPIYSVHSLCRALAAEGHDVHVFTTNVDGSADSDVPLGRPVERDGVKVWYFPSRWLRRLYWSPAMGRALRSMVGQFDLLHLHSVYLWPTWAAARAARSARRPYVLSPRGMLVKDLVRRKSRWLKTLWIALVERRNIARAALVHVTSAGEEKELRDFAVALPRVAVVPNGVDEPGKWEKDLVSEDVRAAIERQPFVLFLGRLNWKKGIDRIIEVWRDVDQAQLLVVGNDEDGYLPTLVALAGSYGVQDRVRFVPRCVTGADKEALYAGARVFVLASYSENFGNTVLEAMARGCPVVVTAEVGAGELLREARAGKVVTGEDLAPAINGLLLDGALRRTLGERGRTWVAASLHWAAVSLRMSDEYKKVLGGICKP